MHFGQGNFFIFFISHQIQIFVWFWGKRSLGTKNHCLSMNRVINNQWLNLPTLCVVNNTCWSHCWERILYQVDSIRRIMGDGSTDRLHTGKIMLLRASYFRHVSIQIVDTVCEDPRVWGIVCWLSHGIIAGGFQSKSNDTDSALV
jgi:hypothetical protein